MTTTRRDFLTTAATAAVGAAAGQNLALGAEHPPQSAQKIPSDIALRVKSLESLLVEKGLVDRAAIDKLVDTYEHQVGQHNGAKVVARAWTDAAYKERLLAHGDAAIKELGFGNSVQDAEHVICVENTQKVHNLIVCTLCSCYPGNLMGLAPTWYKSAPYRSRAVIDPRGVLRELGLELDPEVEVRVWDSTAETRCMVLPERPAGTENFSEEQLAVLVTRDSMIGAAKVKLPKKGESL